MNNAELLMVLEETSYGLESLYKPSPLIRCKDCKHFYDGAYVKTADYGDCALGNGTRLPYSHFCANGKRAS